MVNVTRLNALALLSFCLVLIPAIARDQYAFIDPPPPQETVNFADNPDYELGSTVEVQWSSSDASQTVSLVVFQRGISNDFEYVFSEWRIYSCQVLVIKGNVLMIVHLRDRRWPNFLELGRQDGQRL